MKKQYGNCGMLLAVAAVMILCGGCSSSAPAVNASQENIAQSLFLGVDQALSRAKEVNADIYVPREFDKGMNAYQGAKEDWEKGKTLDRVNEGIAEATSHFKKAVEDTEVLSETLEEVRCRWCGATGTVEMVPRPAAEAAPTD